MKNQKNQMNQEIEAFREHVVVRELEAREAKANYDRYYYTIEASKLRDEYNATMVENFRLQMEARETQQKLIEDAKTNAELLEQNDLEFNEDALPQQEQS